MKNTLADVHNHLVAALERLGDEELKGDELAAECARGKTIADISAQVVKNGALVLRAEEMRRELGGKGAAHLLGNDLAE